MVRKYRMYVIFLLLAPFFMLTMDHVRQANASDYDPLGIRAGAFTIKPKLTLGSEYSDNIYASKEDEESDWIFTVAPEVDIESNWSRHFLGFNTGLKAGFYASESDENYLIANADLNGKLDVRRGVFVTGHAGFERIQEERGYQEDVTDQWDEPSVYYKSTGKLGYYHGWNFFSFTGDGGIVNYNFQSVDLIDGTSLDLDARDRNVYHVNGRFNYERHPGVQPFITGRYEWRRYDETPEGIDSRDSDGYRVGVGSAFYLGGVTSMDVFGGYMKQDYDERSSISGFWYGLTLDWQPTEMTTVTATAKSSVKETWVEASSGIRGFDGSLRVDHAILRNVRIGAIGGYIHDDYKDIDRTDKYYRFGPRLTYLWNRNLSAEAGYTYRVGKSDAEALEYTENRFSVSLTAAF